MANTRIVKSRNSREGWYRGKKSNFNCFNCWLNAKTRAPKKCSLRAHKKEK